MQAKFIPAPDTPAAFLFNLNEAAHANPVIAYGILCAALMLAARYVARLF